MVNQPRDIIILSNGPGEITTWVRPVVGALRQKLGNDRSLVRISVILSPCPNATGKEAAIALSYTEVDRVQGAEHFFPFLLWGKTLESWDWREQGVVLFLGGDQFFSLVIGKRLGYRTVVYAEWDARWCQWIDHFALIKSSVRDKIPAKYHHKMTVVGDLMADVPRSEVVNLSEELIALLPGSKSAKLAQGVPLTLAIAEQIHAQRTQTRFMIPVAPTLDLSSLGKFADPAKNPILKKMGGVSGELVIPKDGTPYLKTSGGLKIELITQFPAYNYLLKCRIALTTVGANTAQLGSLGIPMIVLLPTQQLDAMRSWDGLPGILANLPGLGTVFAKLINWLVIKQGRLFAWPNIWAKEEIVPELVGELQGDEVAQKVLYYLENEEELQEMRHKLLLVRGESGAAEKIAQIVVHQLSDSCPSS
jgi:lipid-A-disaccharide synthase